MEETFSVNILFLNNLWTKYVLPEPVGPEIIMGLPALIGITCSLIFTQMK